MAASTNTEFYNFLQHYDLHKYHQAFLDRGVSRISHLKMVDETDLRDIGLSRPESNRLKKKLEKNFSPTGKLVKLLKGQSRRFETPTELVPVKKEGEPNPHHTASLIAKEEVKLGKKIGEGAHGAVYEGTWSNVHGSIAVAIKTLYGRDEVQTQFIKEADSMRSMNHSHIIRLYGIVLSSPLMLIEELAPFGNLQHYLEVKGKTLNLNVFHTFACQIADAMKYLEDHRIVHRDLATRNVLLSSEDSIKLSDFGMARVLDDHSEIYNLSNLGTRIPIAWTALEALTQAKFSTASDVWSYGVSLWEIYSLGRTPWEGLSPVAIRDNLAQGDRLGRPQRCPSDVYKLMLSCWERLPQDRPTFAEIYERIQTLPPQLVGGMKDHRVVDDPNSLSFKKGELIFVIERPKPEYIFGMKVSGEVGHFLADHVTTHIDTVNHLKEKGRGKGSRFSISGPTDVSHDYHWGSDGKKWFVDDPPNHDIARGVYHGVRNETTASGGLSRDSPPSVPLDTRSPSPGTPRGTSRKVDIQILEGPWPRRASKSASLPRQQPHHDSDLLLDIGPPAQRLDIGSSDVNASEQPEDDQYVAITSNQGRTALLESLPNGNGESLDYLTMEPDLTRLHQYQNWPMNDQPQNPTSHVCLYKDEVPAYASSSAPNRVQSSDSESEVFSSPVPPNVLEDLDHVDRSTLQNPLIPLSITGNTAPSHLHETRPASNRYSPPPSSHYLQPTSIPASGYREEAITPTNVKYLTGLAAFGGRTIPIPLPRPDRLRPSGDPRRATYSTQKSTSFDGIQESDQLYQNHPEPFLTNVKRSLSVGSPGRSKKLSPRQNRVHKYERVPNTWGVPEVHEELQPLLSVGSSNDGTTSPLFKPVAVMEIHSLAINEPSGIVAVLQGEFQDVSPEMCRQALEANNNDINMARKDLQVQTLLRMGIPFMDAEDCKRALSHCQWNMDRAAAWLLDQSTEISNKTT